jgi:hypothetical protein
MVTLADIPVALQHPLILLLIGAGVSGLLVAWLTNRWEDRRKEREIKVENHRKELEIKADIASKMSEIMAIQTANTYTSISRKKTTFTEPEKDAAFKDLNRWYIDINVVNSKLQIYFAEPAIKTKWERHCAALLDFSNASRNYFLEDNSGEAKKKLKTNLEEIKIHYSDNKKIDWVRFTTKMDYDDKLWTDVSNMLGERGEEVIRDVLKLPVKVF